MAMLSCRTTGNLTTVVTLTCTHTSHRSIFQSNKCSRRTWLSYSSRLLANSPMRGGRTDGQRRRVILNVLIRQSDWLLLSTRDSDCFQSRAELEWDWTKMAQVCVSSSQKLCKQDRRFFLTSVKPSTGNISVLREQYLREDLSCHSPWCRVCPATSGMQHAA